MALHSMHRPPHHHHHHSHLGEEKRQMLTLNRRLETYLGGVKLLEEENELLRREIQALRCSDQGASSRRKGLEKELRQARLEVGAAWNNRDRAELELGSLAEELRALGLLWQREAQARAEAENKLEESRREMEEEQRAQIWLREKVNQLEKEIEHQIRTQQEDVAHLEASLTHSRSTLPAMLALTGNQVPSLLQLGQEYSQRATRVWQEAAEAYQGQVARLEESLNQARSRLAQVGQERSESLLKLQALEKELASAQDTRQYLEKSMAQQRNRINQEIQQLQDQLEGLEEEKEELGQQIDALLVDSRGLLQLKMSLSLEVATYRALLDNENLSGDVFLRNQSRNTYIPDAFSSPRGDKTNYQTQLTTSHMTTPLSSLYYHGVHGRSKAAVKSTTSIWTQKPVTLNKTPETCRTTTENYTAFGAEITKSVSLSTPYPKILQNGTVEHFRPQEVHEEVSYAEPLSPPNEQEGDVETLVESRPRETIAGFKEDEGDWGTHNAGPPKEKPAVESSISYQAESSFSSEPSFNIEAEQAGTLAAFPVPTVEEVPGFSDGCDNVPFEVPPGKEPREPHGPIDAWAVDAFAIGKEQVQEETSDSETDAVLEPAFDTSTSSPASECEADNVFDQLAEFTQEENISFDEAGVISQGEVGATAGTNKELEDTLYPDGEEMDSWDSVIERKVDPKKDDGMKKDESETLHAEPEEDISARESEHEQREIKEEVPSIIQHDSSGTFSLMYTKPDDGRQENAPSEKEHVDEDQEDNDEEEDSPNVSVSWRTELESDSYAQDNTLADTRPLIRYKSDETDANTQASHMDESESSEGEEDRRVGETGAGTWSESKTKRFGTMEDLCEEAEVESLDEEYDLGYTHIENVGAGQGKEYASLQKDKESAEVEIITEVSEGPSNEETEELDEPAESTALSEVDYNEEQEMVDRLVEQELESLSTASYSVHFAEKKATEKELAVSPEAKSVKEIAEQEEVGMTRREDMFSCFEPEENVHHKLKSSTTTTGQSHEHPFFSDISAEMSHRNVLAQEEVRHEDQQTTDVAEKREEEDERNVSTVTHADLTEDHSIYDDLNSRPESQVHNSEESNSSEDGSPNASQSQPMSREPVSQDQKELLVVAVHDKVQEIVSVEASRASLEHSVDEVADCQAFPEVPQTADWDVLESPSKDFADDNMYDNVPESAQRYFHDDDSPPLGAVTHYKESPEPSPDSIPVKADIFLVKDSLKTNGKDRDPHGFFGSGINSDFWSSTTETGATYQPDDSYDQEAEQSNQNVDFDDNLAWGNLEDPHVANGNTKMETDSSKAAIDNEGEQQRPSVEKQLLCRDVVEGELVHSEDSEGEGGSWSSGEE